MDCRQRPKARNTGSSRNLREPTAEFATTFAWRQKGNRGIHMRQDRNHRFHRGKENSSDVREYLRRALAWTRLDATERTISGPLAKEALVLLAGVLGGFHETVPFSLIDANLLVLLHPLPQTRSEDIECFLALSGNHGFA